MLGLVHMGGGLLSFLVQQSLTARTDQSFMIDDIKIDM